MHAGAEKYAVCVCVCVVCVCVWGGVCVFKWVLVFLCKCITSVCISMHNKG